ncbi:MAG: hypothetical protein WCA22_19250 [Candidatus Binatus sp.]
MSGSKAPFCNSSARERLRAECERRGIAYPLAFDKLTGSIITLRTVSVLGDT